METVKFMDFEAEQAMYVQRATGKYSCNHCCREVIIVTYSVCVCVCNHKLKYNKAHALYCILICGLSGCIKIFHIIS